MTKNIVRGISIAALFAGTASPVLAGQTEQDAVRVHCETNLNEPTGKCACLAGKAAEMNENQQQLLAAILTGDDATVTRLRAQIPIPEVVQVGMFHVNQTPACAGGG